MGYIWFGVVFICLVKIKSHYFPEDRDSNLGLPQQYSVFYAMGLAMVFQVPTLLICKQLVIVTVLQQLNNQNYSWVVITAQEQP